MEFAISGHCPGCGAGIEIGGSQRLIACPYCRGYNYLFFQGIPRLVILPKNDIFRSLSEALFIPYLRFTGAFFHWPEGVLTHNLLDTSRLAVTLPGLPESLGLRAQVLPARFASDIMDGRYCQRGRALRDVLVESQALSSLAMEMNLSGALDEATDPLGLPKSENDARQKPKTSVAPRDHSAWIGETATIVYAPVFRRSGRWFDGLSGRLLPVDDDDMTALPARSGQAGWQPRFLSAFCPNCGGELQGGGSPGSRTGNSLVVHCPACQSLWRQEAGAWRQLSWNILGDNHGHDRVHLPFWRIECVDKSGTIGSFTDFLTLVLGYGGFGQRADSVLANMPLSFLIPACKVAPLAFLRAARLLTINQARLPPTGAGEMTAFFPVTLPLEEAWQAVTPFLVSLNRKKLMAMRLARQAGQLVFVPFEKTATEFIHRGCGFSLPRSLEFLSYAV